MSESSRTAPAGGERLAKVIARAGLCSRRDAEGWIKDGRVAVNGAVIRTPAFNVSPKDRVSVDGAPLQMRSGTRLWLYHKPPGLVVTEKDPEGRETIFEKLAEEGLPRVVTVGRLDINTEGLLLLTNDGGLKRVLELPSTGWLRRYRVRAFGTISQAQLDGLQRGVEIDGVKYGPIEATLEREQGSNVWLIVALREGKNREVKNVLESLGLQVNRLIRVSYGPFQLGDLPVGGIEVVKARVLREQLGKKLAEDAGVDFDSDLPEPAAITRVRRGTDPNQRMAAPGREAPAPGPRRPVRHRPGRPDMGPPPRAPRPEKPMGRPRRILFEDGREETFVPPEPRGKPGEERSARKFGDRPPRRDGERPPRRDGDRPPRRDNDRSPRREGGGRFEGKSPRPAGKFGDRPPRRDDDRPRPPRKSYGSRPAAAPTGDRPRRRSSGGPKGPRTEGAPRSARPFGDRPHSGPRPGGPARPGGPSRGPRPGGPSRGPRPGGSSRGPRPAGGKPPRKPRP